MKKIHNNPFSSESMPSMKIIFSSDESVLQYAMKNKIVITWLIRKYIDRMKPNIPYTILFSESI